ncbi:MAG: helix-turn-helix domain-containing protein [Pirellulaceae bacterium]
MISGVFSIPMTVPGEAALASFVVGPENALVRPLLAAAVSEQPKYNPLVLCGPRGVGKSSLAQILAERRQASLGLRQVLHTTGAELVRALAHAAETNSVADLRTRYQRCDLLLIDDLQALAGKAAAQQFLTTSLDVLLRRGILAIVTLRGLPQADDHLAPGLASRLSGGLVVPLSLPHQLTRREIVRQLAQQLDLRLGEDSLAQLAALGIDRGPSCSVSRLRHTLMQLASAASHGGERIDSALVKQVLASARPADAALFRQTTAAVARHFEITVTELKGKSRQRRIAEARGLAMTLCRELTGASYAQIGRHFGNRDHTTVLHACKKVKAAAARDDDAAHLLAELTAQITAEGL